MNPQRLITSLAVLCLSLTPGCVFTPAEPGDVTFEWRFDGDTCQGDGRVALVHISIPGEALDTHGFYPCSVNGVDGITLYDFAPGTYHYTLEAIDYGSNDTSFVASGSFTVDGNILLRVNLAPAVY